MKIRSLILFLLAAGCLLAQGPETVQKVVEVKNLDRGAMISLQNAVVLFNVKMVNLPTGLLLSGSPANVKAAEELIHRMDVPPKPAKTVEMTFYIVEASLTPANGKLPAELDPVIKQMKKEFAYQGFHLIDTAILRGREGSNGVVDGVFGKEDARLTPQRNYQIKYSRLTLRDDAKPVAVSLSNLHFAARLPVRTSKPNDTLTWTYTEVGVTTDVDVKEGQKVVVGKVRFDESENALLLVVTARVE
jgi:hypothetical protein